MSTHSLQVGDLLKFRGALGFQSLYHYSVYVGNGEVMHMWASLDQPKSHAAVTRVPVEVFVRLAQASHAPVEVERPANKSSHLLILSRSRQLEGGTGYHVLHNNCEHVAKYIATGEKKSEQVDGVFKKRSRR